MTAVVQEKLANLREKITESLRIQRETTSIDYINVGNALNDAKSKQNHAIFARRGCGKTLLLHKSTTGLSNNMASIYLNCEDFKRHSFPNVLIEILKSLFLEVNKHLYGWFGRKKRLKVIVQGILAHLETLKKSEDTSSEDVKTKESSAINDEINLENSLNAGSLALKSGGKSSSTSAEETERVFKQYHDKLRELDHWLPDLKRQIREFFELSKEKKFILIQVDDLYHLKRTDQAFVVDYIHRLCKDVPLFFKIATLRHASSLYADRHGQPVGAQERHDYQSINIDYTFSDFKKTRDQNWAILSRFADSADVTTQELESLFKGEGFARLVMAGGGVPRDVLSLFLEILDQTEVQTGAKIGKDEVRILSRANFERRIEELKQDSQDAEQGDLIKGIYIIRTFCLDKKTNVFLVSERLMQQNDGLRALFYRLMDYRIIHNCASALTHKSVDGTFQAFAIDIGCYAHLRKHLKRFVETDVSDSGAKDKMRSAPILDETQMGKLFAQIPTNAELALFVEDDDSID